MTTLDTTVLADALRLRDELADRGFRPYVDFEIITVTLSDGAVEIDPCGNLSCLLPSLDRFADAHGYLVMPFDADAGTVSLLRG